MENYMNQLVTIIVPIYKVENYLNRCVDSILNQTYKNLEIVLVNDGSPDKCGEICDQYAKKDSRVKVIHKKNGGLSDARNAGLEISTGKFVSFIDSDDWVHTNFIETLYIMLNETKSDISCCNFIKTDNEQIYINDTKKEIFEFSNVEALEQLYDKLYIQMVVAWGKLYKKSLFKNINFPVGRIHEDEFTTHKLFYKSSKIVYTSEKLLYYWQREDSIMGSGFNLKHRMDALDAFDHRAQFLKQVGLNELSSKAFRVLFVMYMQTAYKIKNELNISEFSDRLKKNLNDSDQKFTFQLFYKTYFRMPTLTYYIYLLLKRIHFKS